MPPLSPFPSLTIHIDTSTTTPQAQYVHPPPSQKKRRHKNAPFPSLTPPRHNPSLLLPLAPPQRQPHAQAVAHGERGRLLLHGRGVADGLDVELEEEEGEAVRQLHVGEVLPQADAGAALQHDGGGGDGGGYLKKKKKLRKTSPQERRRRTVRPSWRVDVLGRP